MDFSQDMVRGSIVPIILALLEEGAMYGYEMVKVVNTRTGGRLEAGSSPVARFLLRARPPGVSSAGRRREGDPEVNRPKKTPLAYAVRRIRLRSILPLGNNTAPRSTVVSCQRSGEGTPLSALSQGGLIALAL